MKIVTATPMCAAMTIAPDQTGAEHYLIVVKQTFDITAGPSTTAVAKAQNSLIEADQYLGDPGLSSLTEACDWAFRKPKTDVIVVGAACSRRGSKAQAIDVRLRVDDAIDKTIRVIGNRQWQKTMLGGYRPTEPIPFERMPLIYERAYGGSDTTSHDPGRHRFHRENLVGVGVLASDDPEQIVGSRLPNLEPPGRGNPQWNAAMKTMCLGFVSPQWAPRVNYAGTYDQEWLDHQYPLLPRDFSESFYQVAPTDQLVEDLGGGERVTIEGMHEDGAVQFAVPSVDLPIVLMFKGRGDLRFRPKPDTLVIRPNERRFSLVWRLTVRCVGKLYSLRQVVIGDKPAKWFAMQRSVKPHYRGLAEFIAAKRLR